MELGVIEATAYDQQHQQLEQSCAAQFSSRPTRRYPIGTLAPHIIGNVGYPAEAALPAVREAGFNQDSILGKSGIEQSWDEALRGRPGGRLLIVSQGGGVLREITRSPSKPSESVWLTLDTQFQADVAAIIAKAYADKEWPQSKGAAAVVMDVHTGAILAMVSYPTYDGNAFSPFPTIGRETATRVTAEVQADSRRPQLNRAVNGLYPLGSVMKTVSAAAVSDSGVYDLDERYTCTGIWTRDITRYDWKPGGHGLLTLPMALTQSSNPYFYEVGYQMNLAIPGVLPQYMEKVGFGHPTGLRDLQESPGFIPNPDWKRKNFGVEWNFSDEVNIAVGQGEVQVTPLQVARWFAAIANGGTLLRPQLVSQVGILGEVPSYTLKPEAMEQLDIKPEVFTMLREGLCAVTQSPAGTAEYQFKHSPLQRIGVCGKTGTAQTGGTDTISHAWFAAWAPMNNPEIAIAVIVENAGEGSGEAAPIVRHILEEYFFGEDASESTGSY
jgi:penicillin-binding protein 2